jgi:hypothetical protein
LTAFFHAKPMKQPIAGLKGIKPRLPKPDGQLSVEEARKLDREYRIQRNEALQLKNHREKMLLAKARHELIPKTMAQQAGFLLVAFRQKIMQVPQTHARRILNLSDYGKAREVLEAIMTGLLSELQDLPEKVTDPGWLKELEADGSKEERERSKMERGLQIGRITSSNS